MKKVIEKVRTSAKNLPEKKQYIEFFTAILTVPVLLTVILLNVNNLRAKDSNQKTTPTPTAVKEFIFTTQVPEKLNTPSTTPILTSCQKDIPPITIATPNENDTVADNPVDIGISYNQGNYCSIVWSYRLNAGPWSDYNNNSVSLYNLTPGKQTFDLRVKSLASNSQTTLTRHFTYTGPTPTLDQSKTGSSSAQ